MGGFQRILPVTLIVLAVLFLGSCVGNLRHAPRSCPDTNGPRLGFTAMSPNGESVAFEVFGPGGGLFLLDWRTDRLTHLRPPRGMAAGQPSFSPDGKSLVTGYSRWQDGQWIDEGIAVFDLTTQALKAEISLRSETTRHVSFPVFQPGSDNVIYVTSSQRGGGEEYLRFVNLKDRSQGVILPPEEGFISIFKPSFIGRDEIIFEAHFPKNKDLKKRVDEHFGYVQAAYRLRFGQKPELFAPEIQSKQNRPFDHMNSISATPDGRTFAYIGLNPTTPHSGRALLNLEIIRLENGTQTQMTDLRNYSAHASLAFDGSAVAFGSDPSRSKCVDLYVLDMKTKAVKPTRVIERLRANAITIQPPHETRVK